MPKSKKWLGLSGKGDKLEKNDGVSNLYRDTVYTTSGDLVPRDECCAEGLCGTPACSCAGGYPALSPCQLNRLE